MSSTLNLRPVSLIPQPPRFWSGKDLSLPGLHPSPSEVLLWPHDGSFDSGFVNTYLPRVFFPSSTPSPRQSPTCGYGATFSVVPGPSSEERERCWTTRTLQRVQWNIDHRRSRVDLLRCSLLRPGVSSRPRSVSSVGFYRTFPRPPRKILRVKLHNSTESGQSVLKIWLYRLKTD